ncbi:MAG TPA: aldo/keto reductase [Ktedonobacterales bacterium]
MSGATPNTRDDRANVRTLGRSGIEVTSVGLGTWAMGSQWGQQDDEESVRALHHALDQGCRFIDTAQAYGDGRSERLIARVFRERRERVPVATKVPPRDLNWETTPGETPIHRKFPPRYLIERCEKSLRNLETDCLDVYQLHTWNSSWNDETEWYEAMLKLREQGKIRAIGISVTDARPDDANGAIAAGRVDTVQLIYNLLDQRPAEQVFPLARQHGVGIIARVPLASGALSGTWNESTTFPEGDWRRDVFTGETLLRTLRYVDALRFLEATSDGSLVEAAVRFSLSDPAVSSVIPGARRADQVDGLLHAMRLGPLSESELQRVHELWQGELRHHIQTSIQRVGVPE